MNYTYEIIENQRIVDRVGGRSYMNVNVIHVIEREGEMWGCYHVPSRSLLSHEDKAGKKYTPVRIEGEGWGAVKQVGGGIWISEWGYESTYREMLASLGIQDGEFKFTKANRVREPRSNPIPTEPKYIPKKDATVQRMTPLRLILSLADGWTQKGQPWFATQVQYEAALIALRQSFPSKSRNKNKADCEVPYITGRGMGYDAESINKTHMCLGWYIQILGG